MNFFEESADSDGELSKFKSGIIQKYEEFNFSNFPIWSSFKTCNYSNNDWNY